MKFKATLTSPILVAVIFTMMFAARFIDVSKMGTGSGLYLSIIALQLVILIFPGVFYRRLKDRSHTAGLNIKMFSPGYIGLIIFTSLALMAGTVLLRSTEIYLFGLKDISYIPYASSLSFNVDMSNVTYTIITFAAVPAIAEEFVFRGVLLRDYQEDNISDPVMVLATSILYGLLYFEAAQFPIYFFAGAAFAFVACVTKSAVASMITHFVFSIYTIFLDGYIVDLISTPNNIIFLVFASMFLFLIFAILAFGEAERINRNNSIADAETPAHVKKRSDTKKWYKSAVEVIASPTFLACVILFAIFSVFSA